ncbi:MAG: CDP-alcohol phosphatidyltransferase family protein [Candidatus Aminicenantales bacterium]
MSFFGDYKKSLKMTEVEEFLDLYAYRPAAYLFVRAIYWTSITPNQITLFSIAVGLAAAVCFGFGPAAAGAGAGLYIIGVVLDCADGQLARLKKNGTRMGRVLDGVVDYITGTSVYVGIGLGLKPPTWPASRWWLLMVAAAASNIFHSMALDYYRTRFLNVIQDTVHGEDEDYRSFAEERAALRAERRRPVKRCAIGVYLRYLDLQRKTAVPIGAKGVDWRACREEFRTANRTILMMWSFLGSSTQITLLVAAVLLGRFSYYFWAMIVALNFWAAILYIVQSRIDRRLEKRSGP